MIYKDKEIIISHHAFRRALERRIFPDMIEATIKAGITERCGKNRIKFIRKYKRGNVICVGEIKNGLIKIITIEWG
jgi:hypothetical protein